MAKGNRRARGKIKLLKTKEKAYTMEGPRGTVTIYAPAGEAMDDERANWLLDKAKRMLWEDPWG